MQLPNCICFYVAFWGFFYKRFNQQNEQTAGIRAFSSMCFKESIFRTKTNLLKKNSSLFTMLRQDLLSCAAASSSVSM